MSNFFEKAVKNFPGHLNIYPNRVQHDLIEVETPSGQVVNKKQESHSIVAQHKSLVVVNASTTVPTALLNGGQCEFRIERGVIDIIDYVKIRLDITNNSGGNSDLVPTPLLVDRIDIFGSNGSKLLYQIYGQELWLALSYLGRDEFEIMDEALYTNASYSTAGTTLANSSSDVLFIPIMAPFMSTKIHPAGLTGELLVRVLFQTTAFTHTSGSLVDCDNARLYIKGRMEPQSIREKRNQSYMEIPHALPFIGVQRMSTNLTLAASTQYNVVLSGLKGICSVLYFTIRATPLTGANQATYVRADTFDLLESDGKSMLGHHRRNADDMLWDYAESYNNQMVVNSNFHYIAFSNSPVQDYTSGTNHGYHVLNSFERLSFTTDASTTGAHRVDIYAFVHENLLINKADISVTRT